MTLQQFNSKYEYQYDWDKYNTPDWIDIWEIIKPDSNGIYKGDCESYVLSLIEYVEEFKNLQLYYCTIDGVGHCIGKINDNWIDCNFKELRKFLPENYSTPKPYSKLQIFFNKIMAKIIVKCLM